MLHGTSHPSHSASLRPSLQRPWNGRPPPTNQNFAERHYRPLPVKLFPALRSAKPRVQTRATFVPAINPDDQQLPHPLPSLPNGAAPLPGIIPSSSAPPSSSRGQEWRLHASNNSKNGRWSKDDESALHKDEPLPLPMAYPGSTPNPLEMEEMQNCDPTEKDCKDVLYQWTGKCSRCQGTGEVSYFPKRGREVICKCIPCMGLGYVHKMTLRTDIDVSDDLDGAP